jgi:hypothetical protein
MLAFGPIEGSKAVEGCRCSQHLPSSAVRLDCSHAGKRRPMLWRLKDEFSNEPSRVYEKTLRNRVVEIPTKRAILGA